MPLTIEDKQELDKYWPGAFSLILPVTNKVPRNLMGKNHKIAVRVTKHSLVKQLCNSLNLPLVSTSANRSGNKPIRNYRECVRQFGKKVLVLPGLTNFAKQPSTIIDWATRQILR
ncbi:MAG: Sua5/YciO/YrdC/YwlC family protein [Burkholderiales bacterium]|nr:Sua5/YciO/YrdC/YwlC family protein [Burkholderiales bacterium]